METSTNCMSKKDMRTVIVDVDQELKPIKDESDEHLMEVKQEDEDDEFEVEEVPDSPEIKYSNTQDYLDIGDTVISEPSGAPASISTGIKAEIVEVDQELDPLEDESKEHLMEVKQEDEDDELGVKEDHDSPEIKYYNTQDYLDIGETVVSEPSGAPASISTVFEMAQRNLFGALPVERSLNVIMRVLNGDQVLLERSHSGGLRSWRPDPDSISAEEDVEVILERMDDEDAIGSRNLFGFEEESDVEMDPPLLAVEQDPDSEEEEEEEDEDELAGLLAADDNPEEDFAWSEDYATFQGQREAFHEVTGPKIEGTDPLELFTKIWDQPIMEYIKTETNRYAISEIEKAEEAGLPRRSRLNLWKETSVAELYRLIAVTILMAMCLRGRVDEYWSTGLMGMSKFRKIMSLDRYWLLMKFIHFTDNAFSLPAGHPKKKLEKIEYLIKYVNEKFTAMYCPAQEISIDETLLLWKGHPSLIQCIGMKTYELCEAITGYCIKFMFCTGKGTNQSEPMFGFTSSTAKTVISLMHGFLGKGYTLFMVNFYNSVGLCRFLKRHQTDVVGTLNRRRVDTPAAIKDLNDRRMARGDVVSRHCGDVSVLAWKDKRLVSMVSTYHNADMAPGRRVGEDVPKPEVVHTYNSFMGGVDLKDQKLSMYLMERKRGIKWYIKVFRRLLNTSILNAYIIHCANVGPNGLKLTHRQFRLSLAEKLVQRFGDIVVSRDRIAVQEDRLNSSLCHFPQHMEVDGPRNSTKQLRFKRGLCKRCSKYNIRQNSNLVCRSCDVFLCAGECWDKYHTEENF